MDDRYWLSASCTNTNRVVLLLWEHWKSLSGAFSGQYLALMEYRNRDLVGFIVEDVQCRHIGNRLRGKIHGVALLVLDNATGERKEVQEDVSKYDFAGFVDERVFVISY